MDMSISYDDAYKSKQERRRILWKCMWVCTAQVVTTAAETPRMKLFHTSHKAKAAVLFISVKQ